MEEYSDHYEKQIIDTIRAYSYPHYTGSETDRTIVKIRSGLDEIKQLVNSKIAHSNNMAEDIDQQILTCKKKIIGIIDEVLYPHFTGTEIERAKVAIGQNLEDFHCSLLPDKESETDVSLFWVVLILAALILASRYSSDTKLFDTSLFKNLAQLSSTPSSPNLQQPGIFMPTEIPLKSK